MNESALGPKLSCTESVTENVKKARQKEDKKKEKGETTRLNYKKRRKDG